MYCSGSVNRPVGIYALDMLPVPRREPYLRARIDIFLAVLLMHPYLFIYLLFIYLLGIPLSRRYRFKHRRRVYYCIVSFFKNILLGLVTLLL